MLIVLAPAVRGTINFPPTGFKKSLINIINLIFTCICIKMDACLYVFYGFQICLTDFRAIFKKFSNFEKF